MQDGGTAAEATVQNSQPSQAISQLLKCTQTSRAYPPTHRHSNVIQSSVTDPLNAEKANKLNHFGLL